MKFAQIKYKSETYSEFVSLRELILRKPLGLTFTNNELRKDSEDILLGCFSEKKIIGGCILSKIDRKTAKLRQMCIKPQIQGKNIGSSLLKFAEETAYNLGFDTLILNARTTALNFYIKNNYKVSSDEFTEVGIPHIQMEKSLANTIWSEEETFVLNTVKEYIDIEVYPFNKPSNQVLSIEKRDPMYGGNGTVYMLSVFQKGELVNNRIGVYMVLMNKGDQAGFHEHGSKKEQELYVVLHGKGLYCERIGSSNTVRESSLEKGNITSIQGDNNYHSITNTGAEPLIVFVVTTNEPK